MAIHDTLRVNMDLISHHREGMALGFLSDIGKGWL